MKPWMLRTAVGVLVLAFGIALGAGPLQKSAEQRDRDLDQARAGAARAEDQVAALSAAAEFATAYSDETAPALVAGKLAGRTVTLVALPGAQQAQVDALRSLLVSSGAKVTAEARVLPAAVDPSGRSLVDALTNQLAAQNKALGIPVSATGYERLGTVLARAIGADPGAGPGGSAYDQTAVGLVSGLQAAGLVKVSTATPRGQLAVFVAGPPAKSASAAGENAVPVALLRAFGARVPTVLAGTSAAAGDRGVLGTLRGDTAATAVVSGVDSLETPMGRVATVLALAARVGGKIGQYGAVDATGGPVPAS